ncbi:type II secretion system secretin GspD [Methylobacter sp. S3L5C]|uniref:type II secretion system secretin GspD n=1 Tax=Methylobacter sp. S3L5C TaxID=2839024 RepID=UPI001FAB989D|nr:type II secretion system secretin GspD [Methylobacter sp. S3L5C]UOA09665.1 type II secretion system secretin GspD [Methylobacter sp. S3L5C]
MNNFNKITTASCFLVMGLSLASCELLGPKQVAKLPLNPVKKEQPGVVFHQLQNKPPASASAKLTSELYPGTDNFVSTTPQQNRKTSTTGTGSYSLNFDEADLGEVAKVILGDILGQNYVLSPKVAGKVTLQTTEPLTKEELLPTLEMVLRMNNAALVKDSKIYHIEPATEALFISDLNSRSGYQTRVIPVRNVAVQDIADIMKPLVHEKTILNVDGPRNILVASGTADEMARVMDLVSTFDIDVLKGRSFGLFTLAHVDPDTIIEELESVFYQKSKEGKSGESTFFQFIPIERLNAVLAVTHQAHYLNDIESWIFRLDKANTASGGGVNVYKVQHVDAEELSDTLNAIFTGEAKKTKSAKVAPGETASTMSNRDPTNTGSSSSSSGSSMSSNLGTFALNELDEKLTADNAPSDNLGAFALGGSNDKSSASGGGAGDIKVSNVGKVKIIADEPNNSIIIVATAQDYEIILPVINQLDVMPLQVLIDATVVQVKLTNKLEYGISWYLSQGNSQTLINSAVGLAGASAAAVATSGLSTFYNAGSVKALLRAEASLDNINVISSPSLMVLNNQKAKINVGDQVPISTGSTQVPIAGGSTGASIAQSNSIQYKDTGVTLDVTPRVNANGLVIMKLKQVVSSVVPVTDPTSTQASSPTINKKEIDSSVAVHDGETIVLGGLISDDVSDNKNGVPFLYNLPVIGSLFGGTKKSDVKTELVILITPRVVKSKQDSRMISNEFKRKLTGIYQEEVSQDPTTLGEPQKIFH